MAAPKVSVIVPIYNTAVWLPRCFDSLVFQTLEGIEIILVNDASTDNSLEIIHQYATQYPEKIRVIDSKVNQRQGGARNLGIEIAQGEYIAFIDSDDWAELTMLEKLYNKAKKNNSDICYCYRHQVTETGERLEDGIDYFFPCGNISDDIRKEIIVRNSTFVQRYIYKRSLFTENNILFPAHLRYEDMVLDPLLVLYAKHISFVPLPLFNYFIRSDSTTTAVNDTKYKDKIQVCKMLVDEFKKRGFYGKFQDEINYLYFRKGYIHSILNYLINVQSPKTKIIDEIRSEMLAIDKNYRNNPYYLKSTPFRILDIILNRHSTLVLRLIQIILKLKKYNI